MQADDLCRGKYYLFFLSAICIVGFECIEFGYELGLAIVVLYRMDSATSLQHSVALWARIGRLRAA